MDNGSSLIFELPGFNGAAAGAQQMSLAALKGANNTSYYKDDDSLWVKLVVDNTEGSDSASSSIEVTR